MDTTSKCASLDTCILMRIIVNDNPKQHRLATELVLNGQYFYIDQAAISESVYVLNKLGYTRQEIVENLQILLHNEVFIYDREFYDSIFARYLSHPSFSFDDCILEARAIARGYTPLWTFDRKLASQSPATHLVK